MTRGENALAFWARCVLVSWLEIVGVGCDGNNIISIRTEIVKKTIGLFVGVVYRMYLPVAPVTFVPTINWFSCPIRKFSIV